MMGGEPQGRALSGSSGSEPRLKEFSLEQAKLVKRKSTLPKKRLSIVFEREAVKRELPRQPHHPPKPTLLPHIYTSPSKIRT